MAFTDYLDEQMNGDYKDIGHEKIYKCPFCGDDKHRLYVSTGEAGDNEGLWICFHCGRKGNPISFVMEYEGARFSEAKETLELYDYMIGNFEWSNDDSLTESEKLVLYINHLNKPKVKERVEKTPPPLPVGYKRIIDNLNNNEVYPFLLYLYNRGFTIQDIIKHNIGYITDGYANTTNSKIPLNNHLVFLTHNDKGEYIYWNTRSIDPKPYVKSVNGIAKDNEYSKKDVLFNLNTAKNEKDIIIVEGVPDALTLGNRGIATFGKQVTDTQVEEILKRVTKEQKLYIMLDMDAKEEMIKLADKLYTRHENTYYVINKTYKDANDLGRDKALDIVFNQSVKADSRGSLLLKLA